VPNHTVRNTLLPLVLIAALAGCSKTTPISPAGSSSSGSAQMNQAAVTATLGSEPDLVEDGIAEDPMQTTIDDGSVPGATAAIRPLTFWRRIDSVNRTFEFAFADTDSTGQPTTATVTVHKKLTGTFNILAGPPGEPFPPRDSIHVVHKALEDHWVRRILLKRVDRPASSDPDEASDPRVRWRIAATSGVQVTSAPATENIVSLRIQSGALDTTITDPLAFFRLRRVLRFATRDSVHLTMTTNHADDVALLYLRDLRFRLKNNGDDTYSGTFRTGWLAGVRHFGVNALSHGTLFDDTAPYDSQAWILPYLVEPSALADYMP